MEEQRKQKQRCVGEVGRGNKELKRRDRTGDGGKESLISIRRDSRQI